MHSYQTALSAVPTWFAALVAGLFGACIASFLGVVGERVPRHETLGGSSHCICGAELGAGNIPIFGWLVLRGRAKCCGSKIPVRYVLGELLLASLWAFLAAMPAPWYLTVAGFIVTALLVLAISWTKPDPSEPGDATPTDSDPQSDVEPS